MVRHPLPSGFPASSAWLFEDALEDALTPLAAIPGWLTAREGRALYRLAREQYQADRGARIVELGSYRGRSTAYLASAARDGKGMPITAVDEWINTDMHLCQETLIQFGLSWFASLWQMRTECAAEILDDLPLALVFVDAGHTREQVRTDWENFGPKVRPGGVLAFHDYAPGFPDVMGVVDTLVREDPAWEFEELVDSLIVFRRKRAG